MDRTTDLTKLDGGADFTWGAMVQIHRIAEYAVVEYHPWKIVGVTGLIGEPSDETSYHCWVEGSDISRSTDSLDGALATCIAYKRNGVNSQAAHYFMKMVGED